MFWASEKTAERRRSTNPQSHKSELEKSELETLQWPISRSDRHKNPRKKSCLLDFICIIHILSLIVYAWRVGCAAAAAAMAANTTADNTDA